MTKRKLLLGSIDSPPLPMAWHGIQVIDDLPNEDECVGLEIGRWFEAQGRFKKGTIHLINDLRR